MGIYELAILGAATPSERALLTASIAEMVGEFELALNSDVIIHDGASLSGRNRHAAFAAVYFGGEEHLDREAVLELIGASTPIIPLIVSGANFASAIPSVLHAANGLCRREDDIGMSEVAAAMLECVGLLREQRRVFVSYRRTESRTAALQIHDVLSARGFDVFLDTHDIRPGDPFQDVLWHRLVDSDVLVMLDTPSYFDSRWTRQEISRARAKDIQILRVIWPGHSPNKLTDLSETLYLEAAHLMGADGPVIASTADTIAMRIEHLRSRSIAARYMAITGKLRADVEKIGASIEGIGAHRAVAVRLLDDRRIWAYPVVGVPSAEILYDVFDKAKRANYQETPVVVYDHVGIRDTWIDHLRWLDENIRTVRAIRVSEAGWMLAAWED